ncbi:MAG: Fur family transcriptional regulator [Chloroflexota bacterium]
MLDHATQQLRQRGFRVTPQRLVILNILYDLEGHCSPQQIFQLARQAMPGLTEATVYRTLNWLTEQGLVLAAHVGSGQLVYEVAGRDHHHLICRRCGHTQEISHTLLQTLYARFQDETGFHIDSIHVTFFGLCPHCQATQPN